MSGEFPITRRMLFGGAAALATVSLTREGHAAPVRGGKLTYARYADSLLLDPVFTDANVDIWVMNSIYDTLLLPTSNGAGIQPGLATKWDFSDDGKALTLTLRQGVKFSDGTEMKASDVKWSLDRARNPKNGAWADMIASIASVDIVDPTTIELKLKHPDPTLLPALTMFNTGILPQAPYEAAKGTTEEEKSKVFAEKPIGTGPFMLADWQRGQRMLLKRNPYYWRTAADGSKLPYLDEVEFPIVPDDATRILKLKAGDVDGTEFVPFSRAKELQADPNLRMELWPSTSVTYVTLYARPKLKNGQDNPLSNTKVRQALNYAVNKDAIIAITTQGLGKPLRSYMSSATPLALDGPPLYPYDLAKAKALLAEAGFGGGFSVSCVTIAGNQNNLNNLTAMQQMWAQIGVKLSIEQMDNPTAVARYRAEDFQMRTGGWTDDIADPSEITSYFCYYPTVHCLHSGWQNEGINKLFEQSQQESDPVKRKAQYQQIQETYNADAPIIYLYQTPYPVVFRKNVHGFVQIPLGNNYFDGAYIEKA